MLMMMLGHVDLAKVRVRARGTEALPGRASSKEKSPFGAKNQTRFYFTIIFHFFLLLFKYNQTTIFYSIILKFKNTTIYIFT